MIVGKNSALKGFVCLALLILGVLTFIATCLLPGVWWILGVLDVLLLGGAGVLGYFYFDNYADLIKNE